MQGTFRAYATAVLLVLFRVTQIFLAPLTFTSGGLWLNSVAWGMGVPELLPLGTYALLLAGPLDTETVHLLRSGAGTALDSFKHTKGETSADRLFHKRARPGHRTRQ